MAQIKSEQIKLIINEVLDGVEKSNIGGVFLKNDSGQIIHDQFGSPMVSMIGANTYTTCLNIALMKYLGGDIYV